MSAPLTSKEIPMKNHIEITFLSFIVHQTKMFKITNTTTTTAAQKTGL